MPANAAKASKILCLGGSFNPIHYGHLICGRAAAEALGIQELTLIPSGHPPHKQTEPLAAPADRLAMCRRAIEGIPGFAVNELELATSGLSYTIQTVRNLKSAGWSEVFWLIGADMLNILPIWHEPQALLREAHLIIMARPQISCNWQSLPPVYHPLRENVVEVPQIDISATEIRRRVRNGERIDFLTAPGVIQYIAERNLYREPPGEGARLA